MKTLIKMPFISTITEHCPANEYTKDTFTSQTFIGEIEFDCMLCKTKDDKIKEIVKNIIKHTHIDSSSVDNFKLKLVENLNKELIMLKNIDVKYETIQTFIAGEKVFETITNDGSKRAPATYEEEIEFMYSLLTHRIDQNLSTDEKVLAIQKIINKPVTTKNPKPNSPNGFGY